MLMLKKASSAETTSIIALLPGLPDPEGQL
jgi:hypothetical protein